jgi:hypothetical protein
MVLEAGDPASSELGVDVRDEFTDRPGPATVTTDVDDPHPREGIGLVVGVCFTDDLVTGTNREHACAVTDGTGQPTLGTQTLGRQDLWSVLAPAQQVDVTVLGYRVTGVDVHDLGGDPA